MDSKLYSVKIESFGKMSKKNDFTVTAEVNEDSIQTVDCIIDFDEALAINIETNEKYSMIPRNVKNILMIRVNEVEFNKLYAVSFQEKNMDKISALYGLYMGQRAKRCLNEYQKAKNSDEKLTKKIGRKK